MRLASLKSNHLKLIASLVGATSSGTKPVLTTSICNALQSSLLSGKRANASVCRVMSIDMGIRNLAFCLMDINLTTFNAVSSSSVAQLATDEENADSTLHQLLSQQASSGLLSAISIQNWRKMELQPDGLSAGQDFYDPPRLAPVAFNFINSELINQKPDLVLIERQRHRSGGSRAILEWTFRVNLLEGMLWAILQTLRNAGNFDGSVHAVSPARVARFWLESAADPNLEASDEAPAKARSSSKIEKERKIALVDRWIRRDEMAFMAGTAATTRAAFLDATDRKPRQKRSASIDGVPLKKVDDLADCLLQGVTWVQWEANRRTISEHLRD